MTKILFRAGSVTMELQGSEAFVARQLRLLSPYLGAVDPSALDGLEARTAHAAVEPPVLQAPPLEEAGTQGGTSHDPEGAAAAETAAGHAGPAEPLNGNGDGNGDGLLAFFRRYEPRGEDRQAVAALLFAYYLHRRKRMRTLRLSDLIRCCIRTGVDTRNFNRTLGALTRRGLFETLRQGQIYRLSEEGMAAVENRMEL